MSTQSAAPGSAPTATVVRSGAKHVRGAMIYGSCLIAVAVAIAVASVGRATGLFGEGPAPWALAGLVFSSIGLTGGRLIQLARRRMRSLIRVDGNGLALHTSEARNTLRWDTLAAVAVQWSPARGKEPQVVSLELCPKGEVDLDAPALWFLIRDEEPLRPDLHRLRYRISGAKGGFIDALISAARQYAPADLWLGEFEREPGYVGEPDVDGHRHRTGRD